MGSTGKNPVSGARKSVASVLVLAAVVCVVAAFWPQADRQAVSTHHEHGHEHAHDHDHAHEHEHGVVHAPEPAHADEAPVFVDAAPVDGSDQNVGADTLFEYVAVFPVGTTSHDLETWRQSVLVRVHEKPCATGGPCLSKLLRLASLGPDRLHAVGFNLQAGTPGVERKAILAAAVSGPFFSTILFSHMSPGDAVSRYATLPVSLMAGQPPIPPEESPSTHPTHH